MAELRLNSEMNLLSTRYRVRSDCACRFKRQKWMVEVLRETSSDIGRTGLTGHERELLNAKLCIIVPSLTKTHVPQPMDEQDLLRAMERAPGQKA
jgi:hypothetical protein